MHLCNRAVVRWCPVPIKIEQAFMMFTYPNSHIESQVNCYTISSFVTQFTYNQYTISSVNAHQSKQAVHSIDAVLI